MRFISQEQCKAGEYNLEVLGIKGDLFEDYPAVIKGYLLHFTLSHELLSNIASDFKISLQFHWKHHITGSLEELTTKLERFKKELLTINAVFEANIDQFAYINLFIVPNDNQYQLVISSDTFDLSKLIKLE